MGGFDDSETIDLTMLDPKLLRTDLDQVADRLQIKKFTLDTEAFNQLEERRKSLQISTQKLQNERNTRSKAIGAAKSRGEEIQPLLDDSAWSPPVSSWRSRVSTPGSVWYPSAVGPSGLSPSRSVAGTGSPTG